MNSTKQKIETSLPVINSMIRCGCRVFEISKATGLSTAMVRSVLRKLAQDARQVEGQDALVKILDTGAGDDTIDPSAWPRIMDQLSRMPKHDPELSGQDPEPFV